MHICYSGGLREQFAPPFVTPVTPGQRRSLARTSPHRSTPLERALPDRGIVAIVFIAFLLLFSIALCPRVCLCAPPDHRRPERLVTGAQLAFSRAVRANAAPPVNRDHLFGEFTTVFPCRRTAGKSSCRASPFRPLSSQHAARAPCYVHACFARINSTRLHHCNVRESITLNRAREKSHTHRSTNTTLHASNTPLPSRLQQVMGPEHASTAPILPPSLPFCLWS